MRRKGHVFLTARNNNVRIARENGLRAHGHGAQAGPAHLIDGQGRFLFRDAGLDRGLARRVLPLRRGKNLAQNHIVDFFGLYARIRQNRLDDIRAQFMRRNVRESAGKRANGGAFGGNDDDGIGHDDVP